MRKEAEVSRTEDGNALGAMLYLSADQLSRLGIDPTSVDSVEFSVEGGEIEVSEVRT